MNAKILYTRFKFGFEYHEYFYYHFDEKGFRAMQSYVPKSRQAKLYYAVNTVEGRAIATDKFASYSRFKKFYKRDAAVYNPHPDKLTKEFYREKRLSIHDFLEKYSTFIAKPLSANSGFGVRIFKDINLDSDIEANLRNEYEGGYILEEVISQSPEMAKFHPSSVNTLRINTVNFGDVIKIMFPSFRIGRGHSIVDNANAGGITVAIDVNTSKTISAADERGAIYIKHPDTGENLVGIEVPRWEEACSTAMLLASLFPENKIVGWDLALSDDGWVIVESNAYPLLIHQIAIQKGIRNEYDAMEKKLLGRII